VIRDDTSVNETVAVIFAVISRVFKAEMKFKQDVKFEVDAVNGKAVTHYASTHQIILLKNKILALSWFVPYLICIKVLCTCTLLLVLYESINIIKS